MKGTRWFFGVCLGALACYGATALEVGDAARAAARGFAQKNATAQSRITPNTLTKISARNNANTRDRSNTTTTDARSTKNVVSRTVTTQSRTGTVIPRTNTSAQTVANTDVARRTTKSRTATNQRANRTARTATRKSQNMTRAATTESGALIANYTGCRTVYYECMDEFCATKDANLRRCACSARAGEFDKIKKQMSQIEDKMLDFNQRLLLVNMDAEDATAINTATEGEDAFYATKDRTKSKKALDDIAKKLNTTFGDSDSTTSLAPISMSLNIDSAFDTVDSFMGSNTTTKTGVALYNAAIPVCREIATEVCNNDELSLAISGYQMLMEQDCNTVYKSYQSQVDAARTKVFESSALLDMSRLDAYQTRNSDDLLTCKRKMLDMLTDSTVCGSNMQNCLDMTGRYIDPTTGNAFLTTQLPELENLITRPDSNQTWTSVNNQSAFLKYLQNKKNYLAAAMENCQVIADSVWDAFIEDALAQIKLAQTAKLEEIRQACTALTTDCLTSTAETVSNFDARALSIFGVAADRAANSLCADVKTACANLIDSDTTASTSWHSGITGIAATKTYDTIISSCTQVGQNCIVQACKSISGNFDLCDDIEFSANRHAILERTSCWPEVLECVGAAGDDTLVHILELLGKPTNGDHKYAFYDEVYNDANPYPILDICEDDCNDGTDADCARCRIAERIWGNCEKQPYNDAGGNKILVPQSGTLSTLLSWFALNTGTATKSGSNITADPRSCVNTRCSSGHYAPTSTAENMCLPDNYDETNDITTDGFYCPAGVGIQMTVQSGITNCCYSGTNYWGHKPMGEASGPCCEGTLATIVSGVSMCLPGSNTTYTPIMQYNDRYYLVCVGGTVSGSGSSIVCNNGQLVVVDKNTMQHTTQLSNPIDSNTARMVYYGLGDSGHNTPIPTTPTNANFFIHYGN